MPGYGTLGPEEGTDSADFTGSPTRWVFEEEDV
jgi:hypothetical protein